MPLNPEKTVAQLERHEGRRKFPYTDTVGKLTIGVGRNLTDRGLSDDEIDLLLANDLDKHWADLVRALPFVESLDEVRQRVLLDMAFMGVPRLLTFKRMIAAVQKQEYRLAALEMLDSRWAQQVGKRARTLADMMRSGEDGIP